MLDPPTLESIFAGWGPIGREGSPDGGDGGVRTGQRACAAHPISKASGGHTMDGG